MTSNQDSPPAGQESSGVEAEQPASDGGRNDPPDALAALAGVRWEDEGIDPDDVEPLEGGVYVTGEFTPQRIITTGKSNVGGWTIEDDDITDRDVEVFYDSEEVSLSIQGESDDVLASELAVLTPHQARQLGAALYQAGEELERRKEATQQDDGGDDE